MKKKLERLVDIPSDVSFDGYVWLSDQKAPEVLCNESYDFAKIGINPFVVEALLYDKENNCSYHVVHTGRYHIIKYDLNNLPEGWELEEVSYLPHRLKFNEISKVNFKQLWVPEPDPYCEDMEVLNMKALIFVGFEETQSKKDV